jgi:thiol-disulfide isomerase/thioredoxin
MIRKLLILILGFIVGTAVSAAVLLGDGVHIFVVALSFCLAGLLSRKLNLKYQMASIEILLFLTPHLLICFGSILSEFSNFPHRFPFGFFNTIISFYFGYYINSILNNNILKIWSIVWVTTIFTASFYIIPNLSYNQSQINFNKYKNISHFPLYTFDNVLISQESLRNKVVILDFSWSGCAPCILKLPYLQALKDKFKGEKDVIFLVADLGKFDSFEDAIKFKNKHGLDFKWVYDKENNFAKELEFHGAPHEVIIDKKGQVRRTEAGFNRDMAVIYVNKKYEFIKTLLAENY